MATTVFSGQWGWAGGEPVQTLQASDGYKTIIPYQVFVDTDTIDGGAGTLTIPATGIYHIRASLSNFTPPTPGFKEMRIMADGVEIAHGYSPNSTGSDYGTPTPQFAGCLEAGTEIEIQGYNPDASAAHIFGSISLLRVPASFTTLDLGSGIHDQFEEFSPICDRPAWWDGGQPTRVTISDTGYYLLSHKNLQDHVLNPLPSVDRVAYVYVNGVYQNLPNGTSEWDANVPLNCVLPLTAGDYVEIFNAASGDDPLTSIDMMLFKLPGTFCGAHIYKSSQGISTGYAPVTFNSSVYDTDGFWAGGTSQYLTVPSGKAGIYMVWSTDLKHGLRACKSDLRSISTGSPSAYDRMIQGQDYAALGNYASTPHFVIWNLDVGDQIYMEIQDGDSGTMLEISMGLAKIDGWTYPIQENCPCPSIVVPPNVVSMYLLFDST